MLSAILGPPEVGTSKSTRRKLLLEGEMVGVVSTAVGTHDRTRVGRGGNALGGWDGRITHDLE